MGNYRKIKVDILDLGCVGGKWTQYMLKAHRIFCVDLCDKFFNYIRKNLPCDNIKFYKTRGNELWGIEDNSIDFIFSMDALVRVKKKYIRAYSRI